MNQAFFQECVSLWTIAVGAALLIALATVVVIIIKHRIQLIASASWSRVKALVDSRLTGSAVIYIALIPLLYQFILHPLQIMGKWLSTFGVHGEISLTTLRIVVVGGVIVVVGRIVYAFQCPKFIQNNKTEDAPKFSDRESDLTHAFAELIQAEQKNVRARDIVMSVSDYARDVGLPLSQAEIDRLNNEPAHAIAIVENRPITKQTATRAFRSIYEFADRTRPAARLWCLSLYGIGAVLVFFPYAKRLIRFLVDWVS